MTLRVAEHVGEMLRANDTGGRSAFEHADRPVGGFINGNEPAVALHDQHGPGVAGPGKKLGELRQIRFGDTADVGIDHRAEVRSYSPGTGATSDEIAT